MAFNKEKRRLRIRRGIRQKISGTKERPRLSVYKSNKGIYAQLIDDDSGHTLASASSKELGKSGITVPISKDVGKKLAEKANKIIFSTYLEGTSYVEQEKLSWQQWKEKHEKFIEQKA